VCLSSSALSEHSPSPDGRSRREWAVQIATMDLSLGGKAGPDLTADWPEIARHATIGLRLTRFQRYPTAAVKRRQSRGQTLACCNGLRAIYWVFDQSMELGLVASRRRTHPVRRSWAAGHRLRAMRRTWARWRDEARGAACRRQTHQSPSDALCWRGSCFSLRTADLLFACQIMPRLGKGART
jgi:hypothetical protein